MFTKIILRGGILKTSLVVKSRFMIENLQPREERNSSCSWCICSSNGGLLFLFIHIHMAWPISVCSPKSYLNFHNLEETSIKRPLDAQIASTDNTRNCPWVGKSEKGTPPQMERRQVIGLRDPLKGQRGCRTVSSHTCLDPTIQRPRLISKGRNYTYQDGGAEWLIMLEIFTYSIHGLLASRF